MIDLRNLETFVWVARLGVFRLAAEKLNTTQPAISARIALLEQDLGVKLFERRPRRAALTPSGVELLGYAERLLSLRAEMVQAVGGATSYKGALRIGVPETIVHTWLALLVERIAEDYPSLTLDIEVDSTANLRQALAAERLDVAITHGPSTDGTLRCELLCSYPLAWLGRANLPLPDGAIGLADLTKLPIVTFRRGTPPYVAVQAILGSAGLTEARIFGSSSIAGIVRMALDGIGTCVLPPAVVQKELREGALRLLPVGQELPTLDFYVNFPKDSRLQLARIVADLAILVAQTYLQGLSGASKNFIDRIENED